MPANRNDQRYNDRGANPQLWVLGASGFAAGPMRKPGAARLVNWFYELPPYRWFLPFGGSGPVSRNGPATTICACLGMHVKAQFWGRKRDGRASPDPASRWGYEASLKTGVSLHPPPAGMYRAGLLPQYSIDRACKRRRMGVDIVQAYAAEISTERTAGTAKAWSTCRAISGCGGT